MLTRGLHCPTDGKTEILGYGVFPKFLPLIGCHWSRRTEGVLMEARGVILGGISAREDKHTAYKLRNRCGAWYLKLYSDLLEV